MTTRKNVGFRYWLIIPCRLRGKSRDVGTSIDHLRYKDTLFVTIYLII